MDTLLKKLKIKHYKIRPRTPENNGYDSEEVYHSIKEDLIKQGSEVKFATFEEIEKLYKENMFMKNRWEFVRKEIREYIFKKEKI